MFLTIGTLVFLITAEYASVAVEANCFVTTIENIKTQICKDQLPTQQIGDEESLRLQGSITYLPPNAFSGLSFFKEIRIIGVGLKDIHPDAFSGLSNTVFLNVAANKLQKIVAGTFSSMNALEILRLEINEINELEIGCFDGLENLKTLEIDQNKIPKIPNGIFNSSTTLEKINLRQNAISLIEDGAFAGLLSLQYLALSGNQIQALPDKVFNGLNLNFMLDLSYNKLTDFPSALSALPGLARLSLMNNLITSLPNPWPLRNLQGILLKNNNIPTIARDLFQGMNFRMFSGSGNPFVCDCRLEGFYSLVRGLSQKGKLVRETLKDYHCAVPDASKSFADITVQDLRNTGNCS